MTKLVIYNYYRDVQAFSNSAPSLAAGFCRRWLACGHARSGRIPSSLWRASPFQEVGQQRQPIE